MKAGEQTSTVSSGEVDEVDRTICSAIVRPHHHRVFNRQRSVKIDACVVTPPCQGSTHRIASHRSSALLESQAVQEVRAVEHQRRQQRIGCGSPGRRRQAMIGT